MTNHHLSANVLLAASEERKDMAVQSVMQSLDAGMIELDSERGSSLGFTSERFGFGSYLWKKDGAIIVSFIESLSRGNFRELSKAILASGLRVEIPTPLGRMQEIVRKAGYVQTFPYCEQFGENVEVWVLSSEQTDKG